MNIQPVENSFDRLLGDLFGNPAPAPETIEQAHDYMKSVPTYAAQVPLEPSAFLIE